MQPSPYSSSSRLAPQWSAQLLHTVASLSDDPQNPQAWRWRIRIKILRYLLSRYGNNSLFERQRHVTTPRFWVWKVLFPTLGKAPRSRKTIRETLERIAAVNEEVRQFEALRIDRRKARW